MTRHVLMCEPAYYRIAYEINPWMRRSNAVSGSRAARQWDMLYEALLNLGVTIELIPQAPDVPDMTFAANAGIVCGKRFLPSNFRYRERQPESARFAQWFVQRGYTVEQIHQPHYWEGEGDVLAAGSRIYAGYRFRTEYRALDHLDELLGTPVRRLELVDERFYHLDTCFCPLGEHQALFYPPAFSVAARATLEAEFADLIAVADEDALRFACNAVVVDHDVVINAGCRATLRALELRGYHAIQVPTDEFIKAGGSAKCLVLTLDSFPSIPPAAGGSPELAAFPARA